MPAGTVGLDIDHILHVQQRGVAVHRDGYLRHRRGGRRRRRGGTGLQHLTHPAGIEGLEDVVIHLQFERLDRVFGIGGGKDDLGLRHEFSGQGCHGGTQHISQTDINKQQVKALLLQKLHGLHAGAGLPDLRVGQDLADLINQLFAGVFLIIDHSDLHAVSSFSASPAGMVKRTVDPAGVLLTRKRPSAP